MSQRGDDLDDNLREELLAHVGSCLRRPTPDPDARSTAFGSNEAYVCEHIAKAIAAKQYFTWDVATDRDAIQGFRLCCSECRAIADDTGAPPGERWRVCDRCSKEYSLRQGWPELTLLAPRAHETFSPWWTRVAEFLPHVPADIADQWIHRHWGNSPFEWLPFLQMTFRRETWPIGRILSIRAGKRACARPNHRGAVPLGLDKDWLGPYMSEHCTWPRPIIVLDNSAGRFSTLHELQLLEGHTRLGYLRTLVDDRAAQPTHEVWVAIAEGDSRAPSP